MEAHKYVCFLLIFATIIMLSILFFSCKKFRVAEARSLSAIMLTASFYSFGYAMQIVSTSVDQAVFWLKFQFIGIPFIPVLWLILAIQYTGYGKYFKKQVCTVLFIIPVITVILSFTNEFHHLLYTMQVLYYGSSIKIIYSNVGAWMWFHITYSYMATASGIALYITMFVRSVPVIRKQIILMLLGASVPWVMNILNMFNLNKTGFDLVPFGFAVSGIFLIWGIFRFNILSLTPIALEKVFESMNDGIVILDFENSIVNYNNSSSIIIRELEEVKNGQNNYRHIFQNYPEILALLDGGEEGSLRLSVGRADGTRYYNVSVTTIYDNRKKYLGRILVFSDITKQRELMIRLDRLASIDELTQLYNRRHFYEKCRAELERARRYRHPLSFIIFDLDYFKRINDTYGHHIGDLVLKHIADICRDNLRRTDICARYGGEEFAVLMPETECEEAVGIAERLRLAINNAPVEVNNIEISINASFGVHGFDPATDESLSDLMIRADRALYRAKSQGRNRVVLYG